MIPSLFSFLNKEKRKRILLPFSILFIGIVLIVLPLISIAILILRGGGTTLQLFSDLNWYQIVLILLPLPIGIGLLRVKKSAWYGLIVYGIVLILWNVYTSINHPSGWNSFALAESVIFLLAVVYFLKKDISSPYFKLYPRGWRGERRYPIHITLLLNGESVQTNDLSLAGFYCKIPNSGVKFKLNQEVSIRFPGEKYDQPGGVVRVDENGLGIAFRNLTKKMLDNISQIIKLNIVGLKK